MENICWGFICLLFIVIFLVSNFKLCFATGHHFKVLANSVQIIYRYLNAQLIFKDVDVKSLITFIRFHILMGSNGCHAYVPVPGAKQGISPTRIYKVKDYRLVVE